LCTAFWDLLIPFRGVGERILVYHPLLVPKMHVVRGVLLVLLISVFFLAFIKGTKPCHAMNHHVAPLHNYLSISSSFFPFFFFFFFFFIFFFIFSSFFSFLFFFFFFSFFFFFFFFSFLYSLFFFFFFSLSISSANLHTPTPGRDSHSFIPLVLILRIV